MLLRAAFVPPPEAVERLCALGDRLARLPGVRPVEPDRVDVPIAGLGNLVERDAHRFAGLLAECLSDLEPIVVRPVAVEVLGEDVTVRLDGDLPALSEVARAVGIAAQGIRVLVDRRAFRPAVVVGSGTPAGIGPGTDVLGELAGTAWLVEDVDLVRTRWHAGEARAETAYRIPFGLDGFGGRDFRTG
jgi:hypothetical protein